MQLKYLLLGLAFVLFLGTVSATVDVNLTKPGMANSTWRPDTNYSYYVSNNINSGNVFIGFRFKDTNMVNKNAAYRLDANIYYSDSTHLYQYALGTDVNLVTDANAAASGWTNYDKNIIINGTDSNQYVWLWRTTQYTITDGNYFIDVNVFNNNYRNVGVAGTADGNVDYNRSYLPITIDNTNPTATISSGGTVSSGNYLLVYTGSDATAGVKKYFVSNDNTVWIDNGRNLTYSFTAPTFPHNSTFYVKSQDFADNNSTVQSVVVTAEGGGGTPRGTEYCGDGTCNNSETSANCPADCAAVCGDGACTRNESSQTCPSDCATTVVCGNGVCEDSENYGRCPADCRPSGQVVKQVVLSRTSEGKPSAQDIRNILTAAGASQNAIEKASDAVAKTDVQRKAEVVKETSGGRDTFVSKFTIKVSNTSAKKLRNLKVVEHIPKSVAASASEIVSNYRVRVLKADPIVEFTIDELSAGQEAEVSYAVEKQVTAQSLSEYLAPVVSSFAADEGDQNLCAGKTCNDENLCTTDSCADGTCFFSPVSDGTVCGFGKECRSGNCVQVQSSAQGTSGSQAPQSPVNFTLLVVVLLVVVIGVGFYYYNKQSKPQGSQKRR